MAPLRFDRRTLAHGVEIPVLGLGTWQLTAGRTALTAVRDAIAIGYRHIDTAALYGNEADVGRAVRESGVSRSEIFLTTKLWDSDHGRKRALAAFEASLERLGLATVGLYLIHWPSGGARRETWDALVTLREQGRCRAIGVSNYTIVHLEELLDHSSVAPAVNQVEFSPFLFQKELLEFCTSKSIVLTAYTPLARARRFKDPVLVEIAAAVRRTPAQVMLRWAIQHGVVVIPKSSHRERIEENARIFDFTLSGPQVAELDGLNEDFRLCPDPSVIP